MLRLNVGAILSVVLMVAVSTKSTANTDVKELKDFLNRFHANPAKVLDEPFVQKDIRGNIITEKKFTPEEVASGAYIEMRDAMRSKMCTTQNGSRVCLKDTIPGKSGILPNEQVDKILETTSYIKNIQQMESSGLTIGAVTKQPWSETFWPMVKGVIGNRYSDPGFPNAKDWLTNFSYIAAHPATSFGNLNALAPSEKYDLIIGDNSLPLTRQVWGMGEFYQNLYGRVWGWMGICHGWSGAAINLEEPVTPVVTSTADGRSITLYPSDIKGLASLLWATAPPDVHFIGDRCRQNKPAKDMMGRIIPAVDQDGNHPCVDVNPGTWHMTATNLVGAQKQSFVLDNTYDLQVWNHPVQSYEYTYFNPQTLEMGTHWRQASVPLSRFTIDKFKTYRSTSAVSVVGVFMKVTIMDDSMAPSHSSTRGEKKKIVNYVYDLEIDAQGNIIGGEWYSNIHPDFLWRGPVGKKAMAIGDTQINPAEWDGIAPIPAGWRGPATISANMKSSKNEPNPEPLAAIVEKLIERSK
ncbi:MAG: hypothetical protein SGI74_06635 [Oligoflexia bacterium]|nr:hypothetical protein [Oligoflexia bacterium]